MQITPGIVAKVEESIAVWEKSGSVFSWPDGACFGEPWSYELHSLWVTAFNESGRKLDGGTFLRQWMKGQAYVPPDDMPEDREAYYNFKAEEMP